jgi:hypothetical protein
VPAGATIRRVRGSRPSQAVAAVFLTGAILGAGGFLLLREPTTNRVIVVQATRPALAATTPQLPPATYAPDPRQLHLRPVTTPRQSGGGQLLPAAAEADFAQLEARLGGQLGVAVAPLGQGHIQSLGTLSTGHAWSAIKVALLATLLNERGSPSGLSGQESTWARLALTQSDNQAALGLFGSLERTHSGLVGASGAIQRTLRQAGDTETVVNTAPNAGGFTTFGQTIWSAQAATRFFQALALGCLLPQASTRYVLGLMSQVVSDQRWGFGAVSLGSTSVAFKGGWGPENGGPYLVRQSAIVGSGGDGYVATILAEANSGSFSAGTDMVTGAAQWLAQRVNAQVPSTSTSCV